MYQTGKNGWWKHWDFMILDVICLQAAYITAFMLRHGMIFPYKWEAYRNMGLMIILLDLCAGFFLENYKDILRRGYFEELKKTVLQISVVVLIVFACMFLAKESEIYSRAVFVQMWLLGILITYAGRWIWKFYLRRKMTDAAHLQKLVVISELENAENTIRGLEEKEYKDFYVSGIILLDNKETIEKKWNTEVSSDTWAVPAGERKLAGVPVLGYGETCVEALQQGIIDEVFIDGHRKNEYVKRILSACEEMGITTHYNLGKNFKTSGKSIVEEFAGHTVLTSSIKFADQRQILAKRVMDILGGLVGILLTGVLTLILAPIIYIQSPGPIFFSQKRVGRNGRIFKIYKFRSMYPDAEARKQELMKENKMQGLMFKMDDDPRIIPIGKFIRKTSLDEFPQFFNVLKGDMSLVGTRPPTLDEYNQYEMHHKVRLAAKPGLTGMWQVSGRSDIVDFEEVVALDKKYIEEWNIGMDLRILFQTVKVVVTGKGSV